MSNKIITIKTKNPARSLCWDGENLIDFADGGNIYQLNGETLQSQYFNAFKFDAAIISPSKRYAVAYEKLGTKGVVFHGGKIIREINRSFYFAQSYEYPVTLFQLPDGREVIAHCPDEYNKLEIEELETGKRLTEREDEPKDYFFSRLVASSDGRYLMSAGWIWHPLDLVEAFDVNKVLQTPSLLDKWSELIASSAEGNSACFLDNKRVVVCSSGEAKSVTNERGEKRIQYPPETLTVFDLYLKEEEEMCVATEVGTVFAIDDKHILGVYEHPKVVNIETGEVVQAWPELKTGKQNSSILMNQDAIPPMAWDKATRRLAVVEEKTIRVIDVSHLV